MERGTWIVLSNSGGELDRYFIADENNIEFEVELVKAIQVRHWILHPGDTIHFDAGESEDG